MQGLYKVRLGNKTYEYENVITNIGKQRILNSVAGKSSGFASSIVAGIGTVAATSSDVSLEYLVGGGDINASVVDYINNKIYIKATLPSSDQYEIHELGCFDANYDGAQALFAGGSVLLVVFGSTTQWIDTAGSHTYGSNNNRIGLDSIEYAINTTTVTGYTTFSEDFSSLPVDATFDLAYYVTDLSAVVVRFKFDDDNYFEGTFAITNGYNISKIQKGTFTATGSPDWAKINYLEVSATSTTTTGLISLDSIRYSVPPTDTEGSGLLSRVVLDTPQTKLSGVSMDVEYVLSLGL